MASSYKIGRVTKKSLSTNPHLDILSFASVKHPDDDVKQLDMFSYLNIFNIEDHVDKDSYCSSAANQLGIPCEHCLRRNMFNRRHKSTTKVQLEEDEMTEYIFENRPNNSRPDCLQVP